MTSLPKISIVTPSFNQGRFIEKTILSVIEQDYPNLEYIIIDGGSTDESVEIIKKYEKHLAYWVSEPDRGQSHAINKGFERATGEIFGWLNSDDWYHPGALKAVAEAFAANPDAGAVVGAGEMVDEEGNTFLHVARKSISLESLFEWKEEFFWQPSCFFRKTVWDLCGPLNIDIHYAMDLDLWIKIAIRSSFLVIDELLSFSLKHRQAKTTEYEYLSQIEAYWIIWGHGGEKKAKKGIEEYVKQLFLSVEQYKNHVKHLNNKIDSLEDEIVYQKRVIEELRKSFSWKITKPLRDIVDILHK